MSEAAPVRLGDVPTIDLAGLGERHDALLIDAYGVLIESGGPLPGAAAALRALDRAGTPWWVLTNDASRLPESHAARYADFGLAVPAERILTSGALLEVWFRDNALAGAGCVVLGPPDSARYVERAGGEVLPIGEDTSFEVLVVGDEAGFDLLDGLDATLTALFRRLDRGDRVRLVLPNPDRVYPKGGARYGITAGAIAPVFEGALAQRYPGRAGLRFERLGKPHAPIFAEARRRCRAALGADAGEPRLAMVGDQLATDVRGAIAAGIDAVLVGTGLTPWDEALALGDDVPRWRMRAFVG